MQCIYRHPWGLNIYCYLHRAALCYGGQRSVRSCVVGLAGVAHICRDGREVVRACEWSPLQSAGKVQHARNL